MNKGLSYLFALVLIFQSAYALDTVFDSMDKATEVKLAPAISKPATTSTPAVSQTTSLKEQKYNTMLINLDDAQVDLRQELSTKTTEYNNALIEKKRAIQNCKDVKKELSAIKKEMKNNDKSKKMITKNLETLSK